MNTIADAIRAIRRRQGKTMVDFASSLGLKQGIISLYENAKVVPSRSVLIMLYQMAQEGEEREAILKALGGEAPTPLAVKEQEFEGAVADFKVVFDAEIARMERSPGARLRFREAVLSIASSQDLPIWLIEVMHLWISHQHIPEAKQEFYEMYYWIRDRLRPFEAPPENPKKRRRRGKSE